MNLIEKAVRPLKVDAVSRAETFARNYVEKARGELEAAGWDINAAAPYPFGMSSGSFAFYVAREKHNNFHGITKQDPKLGYQSSNGVRPVYVVMDDERVERFVKARMDQAAAEYEAFVAKLIKKIGEVTKATLEGNHVWAHSILTVVTAAGETQRWKTQQIENYSKYGKHFYQWPTRLLKKGN